MVDDRPIKKGYHTRAVRFSAKVIFDRLFAFILLLVFSLPMIIISILIRATSRGAALYWSDRVGVNNTIFTMPKFRTMKLDTPPVATHLLQEPGMYITPIGRFLRGTSLDELPQMISILKGDMSFVGPRPALYNQYDLISLRTQKNIHTLLPGLTGWAQVNGRDELPISQKVELDEYYYHHRSFLFDMMILALTAIKVITREGVKH